MAIWMGTVLHGVSFHLACHTGQPPPVSRKGFGSAPGAQEDPKSRPLIGENREVVEKALRGEWVDHDTPSALNHWERGKKGQPSFLTVVHHARRRRDA
jgi:hypothetical protein